jgi:hypothetical protein
MGRLLAGVFKARDLIYLDEWTIERVHVPRGDGGGGFQRAYRFNRAEVGP